MRLGRLILLASLAPLLGIPALTAILTAAASSSNEPAKIAFVAPTSDFSAITASPERTSRLAVLALTVLADTPLRHSLWMMEGPAASLLPVRTPQHFQLRC